MKTTWINFSWKNIAVASAVIAASMVSCKDTSEDFADEEATTQNSAIADNEADDIAQVSYAGEFDSKSGRSEGLSGCAKPENDKVNKILTFNFGTGCTGLYGRNRSGIIKVLYDGVLGDSLAKRTITFENYKVNGKSIEGTIEVEGIRGTNGNPKATRKINLKITFGNGKSVTLEGTRTREWTSGYGNSNPDDNKYSITGELQGTTSTGRSFTQTITSPIIVDFSCAKQNKFARIGGIVELTKVGGFGTRKRTVDYGDGVTCDNIITITTFRRTYTVTVD